MSSEATRAPWEKEVEKPLPALSPAQGRVFGPWSYGIVLTGRCGITRVSTRLAKGEDGPPGRVRERLREWDDEASARRGSKRREVRVEECFADRLRWALEGWQGEKRVVLAVDVTSKSGRLTVLESSLVLRGGALPIAWQGRVGKEPGAWKGFWREVLERLRGAIGADWNVLVLTDQGRYAAWRSRKIGELGWFAMRRVSEQMGTGVEGERGWTAIGQRVKRRGRRWQGQGERLTGTLLVRWEAGDEPKRAVVTALPEEEAQAGWDQMRLWTEGGFKDQKRGLLGWEQTKRRDPERVRGLWLAMAVAMRWMVRVGSVGPRARTAGEARDGKARTTSPAVPAPARPRTAWHRARDANDPDGDREGRSVALGSWGERDVARLLVCRLASTFPLEAETPEPGQEAATAPATSRGASGKGHAQATPTGGGPTPTSRAKTACIIRHPAIGRRVATAAGEPKGSAWPSGSLLRGAAPSMRWACATAMGTRW